MALLNGLPPRLAKGELKLFTSFLELYIGGLNIVVIFDRKKCLGVHICIGLLSPDVLLELDVSDN